MRNLQINTEELPDNIVAISLVGSLDIQSLSMLQAAFEEFYKQGVYKYIVDLSRLKRIISSGVGLFIKFLEDVRKNEGDMILINPMPVVRQTLNLIGLTQDIKIVDDQATALNALAQKGNSSGK